MKKIFWFLVIILVVVLLALFLSKSNDTQFVGGDVGGGEAGDVVEGMATIDEVEIYMLESMPVKVNVVIRGSVPDGCTEVGEITQRLEEDAFYITVPTVREKNVICTQALVQFSKTITLEATLGLGAGEYVVDVNGVQAKFELDVDNKPQESGSVDLPGVEV